MFGSPRWKRTGKTREAAAFLRSWEPRCVSACSRFLRMDRGRDHLWKWPGPGGEIRALIFHYRRILFPLLDGGPLPPPRFMEGFLRSYPIHAVQGLRGDAEQMEAVMAGFGYEPAERIDYDLMALDRHPLPVPGEFPPGLVLRPPREEDGDGLFALQAAYEREEVLPRGAVFDPAVCRLSLDRILKRERVLVAELDSRLVGKINTSALSFSRCQIGGVYVHPAFRGRGIARRMAAVFVQDLFSGGPSLSLFVKKRNTAARAVYLRTGFETIGDYRITYY